MAWCITQRRPQLVQTQHQNDLQIAQNQQQATLEMYLDRMTNLILNNGLNNPKTEVEIRALAWARTLTTLLLLDPGRKAILIQCLYASRLIDTSGPIIDLRGVNLSQTHLEGVDLSGTDLSGANLSLAFLNNANLSDAFLTSATLSGANLDNADLSGANLFGAQVTNGQLAKAKSLKGAVFDRRFKVILPRICGREKVLDILFPKEGKDHAEGAKDLYTRV